MYGTILFAEPQLTTYVSLSCRRDMQSRIVYTTVPASVQPSNREEDRVEVGYCTIELLTLSAVVELYYIASMTVERLLWAPSHGMFGSPEKAGLEVKRC
jgi:hypothetical protein